MSYIGASPSSTVFLTDQFSGNGATVGFNMSTTPAGSSSLLVSVSGVLQDPTTYSVTGSTLTFSTAPPTGTGNISVRYLGIPASGVTTTAYRTITEFTATAGQTTFTPPSYTVGFIAVYRNGVRLGAADFTATNGTSIILGAAANLNDLITTESFYVSSVLNAIPSIPGAVNSTYLLDSAVTTSKIAAGAVTVDKLDSGAQYTGFKNRIINGGMRIDQRNAGAAVTGNGSPTQVYAVDRTYIASNTGQSGNTTVTGQRVAVTDTTVPHDYALRATVGNTASRGTNYDARFQHNIEGNMVADIFVGSANATPFTVSFWARASKSGRAVYQIWGAGMTPSFIKNVSLTTSWQKFVIPVPALTDAGNTKNTDNQRGFGTGFYWAAGALPTTTDGTWSASHALTNFDDYATSGDWIEFTGYQLEKGSVATSFDYRPYSTELALCQRYYWKNAPASPYVALATGPQEGTWIDLYVQYPVIMRAAPTLSVSGGIVLYGTNAGTIRSQYNGTQSSMLQLNTTSSSPSGTANSWICDSGGAGNLQASAEL